MATREAKARSLAWINSIRLAQRQHAQFAAGTAAADFETAKLALHDTEHQSGEALVAWEAVAGSDLVMASIWAGELFLREARLSNAQEDHEVQEHASALAHANWQQAVARANRVADDVAVARRRVHAHRAEQNLATQSDGAAYRNARR
jgi:hypothetical protein